MAEIHVSTWDDFKSELTLAADGDIIYLDKDLDAGDDPFTTYIDINACTIEGQEHHIYNISCYSNNACIRGKNNKHVTWNNIHFDNIFTTSNIVFTGYTGASSSGSNMYFNNCTFQGRWASLMNNSFVDRCYISGKGSLCTSSNANYSTFTNTYIDLTRKRNDGIILHNCRNFENNYITGTIDMEDNADNSIIFYSATTAFNPLNCIFNLYVTANSEHTYRLCGAVSSSYTEVTLYNTDRLTNVTISQNQFTGISDTNLKNAQAVADTGFPIVVQGG